MLKYIWRKGLWSLLSLGFILLIIIAFLFLYMQTQLPDVKQLKQVNLQVPLRIYTADNKLIAEYGEKRRSPIGFDKVPKQLTQAILATEDQRFYEHPGVDIFGLARAFVELVRTGTKSQGGSTITMQVARNFFLTNQKTFLRKFNEILLAIKIEYILTKENILELYVNKIYLGNRAYGVAAAAQVYYGKSLQELSLPQLAMLAGLPKAPSAINPLANPKAAKHRRNYVLLRMYEEHYIDKATYLHAIQAPITASYHYQKVEVSAPYIAEMVRQRLFEQMGEDAYTGGFQVFTTIESKLQTAANQAMEINLLNYDRRHGYRGAIANLGEPSVDQLTDWLNKLSKLSKLNSLQPAAILSLSEKTATALFANGEIIKIPWSGISWARPQLANGYRGRRPSTVSDVLKLGDIVMVQPTTTTGDQWRLAQIPQIEGALVSLAPQSGAIASLVGGLNFNHSHFNRVTQAKRQPGSSFKPFVYAAALEKGLSLATIINDAPVVFEDSSLAHDWRPQNDNRQFAGLTRLRMGLIRSRNLVSIRILNSIGIAYTIEYLQQFGFKKEDLPPSLSLALGSLSITPLELAAGYATIANGGFKVEPYFINFIKDYDGHTIFKANHETAQQQIMTPQVAYLMNHAMADVIARGTGRDARTLNRNDLGGKTGTTNQQIDGWFAGFNGDYATIVWVGFDQPKTLREYARQTALPLWNDYMKVALKDKPENRLVEPEGIVTVRIDAKTGLLADENTSQSIFEIFRKNNVPIKTTDDTNVNPYNNPEYYEG